MPVPPLFRGHAGEQFSNFAGIQTNPRIRGGITGMPSKGFGGGQVPPRQQRFTPETLRNASLMTGRLPVVPSKQSLGRGGNVPPAVARTLGGNERFFSRSHPVAPAFKPFNEQVAQTQKMIQNSRAQMQSGSKVADRGSKLPGAAMPQNGRNEAMKSFPASSVARGGRSPVAPAGRMQTPAQQSAVRQGWHSFGASGSAQTGSSMQGRGSERQPVATSQHGFDQPSRPTGAIPSSHGSEAASAISIVFVSPTSQTSQT